MISMHCIISPEASFIPAMFGNTAKRKVVSAVIFLAVRPGTLYKIIGLGAASAMAL